MEGGAPEDCRWIHVLLKGERPITDTTEQEPGKIDKYVSTFKDNSLEATTIPILDIDFTNLNELSQNIEKAMEKKTQGLEDVGIVLTSPRAVEAISRSLSSKLSILKDIDKQLIFVVGEKTGSDCLSKLGIKCNEDSSLSGNSSSLSEVIKLTISTRRRPVRLIYPKSSLADRKIEEALVNERNVVIDSVIAYETRGTTAAASYISSELEKYLRSSEVIVHNKLVLNFVFFSPSGVECFYTIKQQEMLSYLAKSTSTRDLEIKYSCIGQTTEGCLRKLGADVHCVAEKPSAQALVDAVLLNCPARK